MRPLATVRPCTLLRRQKALPGLSLRARPGALPLLALRDSRPLPQLDPSTNLDQRKGLPWMPGGKEDFETKRGRTCDVLREAYPQLFTLEPDLSIYRHDIEFRGFQGVPVPVLKGLDSYRRLFGALRMMQRTTVAHHELSFTLTAVEATVRVRWQAQLWLRLPLRPLISSGSADGAAPVYVDGISAYELDEDAQVATHRLEWLHPLPTTLGDLQLAL